MHWSSSVPSNPPARETTKTPLAAGEANISAHVDGEYVVGMMPPWTKRPLEFADDPGGRGSKLEPSRYAADREPRDMLLAARLGVSRSTLQSWRYAGRGPRFIKLGRMVRYRTADIDAYLREHAWQGRLAVLWFPQIDRLLSW